MNLHTSRRSFLAQSAALTLSTGLAASLRAAEPAPKRLQGKADSCIFLWLGGGACHIDTWDPKVKGDAKAKKAGSYYDPIPTAIEGVQVSEHLRHTAPLLDRGILFRTVNHDVIDEHAAATNRLHTGRPPNSTTTYPSLGSVVSHELGPGGEGVPPYVVIGYPSATRGPGFLGARHGYVYLTDTEAGPAGLKRAEGIGPERQARRDALLAQLRDDFAKRNAGQKPVENYTAVAAAGEKLAGPQFMRVFDLATEPDALRSAYGSEFGQRCLLSRRLVESGVRFVETSFNLNFLNGTGWDTHNEGQREQHVLIQGLDQALAALLGDLEKRRRLDRTLVVVATEFGRPPEFDGGGGRGHYSKAFSIAMFGGGLKTGQAIGVTDELGKQIVERPVSVPDLHAAIYSALGIDPSKELYDGERPVPITDRGVAPAEAFV